MKTLSYSIALFWALTISGFAAAPVVSSLTAVQRTGTKLVDISYGVTANTASVKITLEVSADGGVTWTVPVSTVSGAVGSGVATGTGKVITWNAGVDWGGQYSTQIRFRVTADDLAPGEFAAIPAGEFQMGEVGSYYDFAHTVTVSAFQMATCEVTKVLWDDVRSWGLANGYTDLSAGAGKASNHPVQMITWYDMAGNVSEICWDWSLYNYYSTTPTTDPHGPISGTDRVMRGGSWAYDQFYCRASDREYKGPSYSGWEFGFRLARTSIP